MSGGPCPLDVAEAMKCAQGHASAIIDSPTSQKKEVGHPSDGACPRLRLGHGTRRDVIGIPSREGLYYIGPRIPQWKRGDRSLANPALILLSY